MLNVNSTYLRVFQQQTNISFCAFDHSLLPCKIEFCVYFHFFPANPKKDTVERILEKDNYVPKLKTFEQDIMDSMGIKETRKRGKTYWY